MRSPPHGTDIFVLKVGTSTVKLAPLASDVCFTLLPKPMTNAKSASSALQKLQVTSCLLTSVDDSPRFKLVAGTKKFVAEETGF